MAIYKTAQGRTIDMAALAAKNERVRAVGNMSVNARGDTIDSLGNVVVPVTKKVGDSYQRTISNRAANLIRHKRDAVSVETSDELSPVITPGEVLTAEEIDIDNDADAEEIEAIKAAETQSDEIMVKPASEAPEFFEPEPIRQTKRPVKKY